MKRLLLGALIAMPGTAPAQTLTFEVDDSVLFIRCTDMFGSAMCEIVGDGSDRMMTCVALDVNGDPIASSGAFANDAQILFPELNHEAVDDIVCR